jgi:hypothetical protein
MTKQLFLAAKQCRTSAWFSSRQPASQPLTPGEALRIREGLEVGRRARSLFPDGVLVEARDPEEAAALTQQLMQAPAIQHIFEAAFLVEGFVARADVLSRRGAGWVLREVKSSFAGEEGVREEHLDDVAYTFLVLERAGVRLEGVILSCISRGWRLGHPDVDLFEEVECIAEVVPRVREFAGSWESLRDTTCEEEKPAPYLCPSCKDCEFFNQSCLGVGLTETVLDIPRLGKKLQQLADAEIVSLHDLPTGFALTKTQERFVRAARTREPEVDRRLLTSLLAEVRWPAYYLDFETVKTVIPLWPEVAPHEQVVTQYSLHVCDGAGRVADHRHYLAESDRDCRRELVEKLLADLGDAGSVVVYSPFEKTQLNSLAARFGDLAGPIGAVLTRLFDLEKVFRDAYYHPAFRGRSSIKATLPALVPEMTYDGLSIGDGDTAMARFAAMVRGECTEEEARLVRENLLRYCGQDTLGMVRLHEVMCQLVV